MPQDPTILTNKVEYYPAKDGPGTLTPEMLKGMRTIIGEQQKASRPGSNSSAHTAAFIGAVALVILLAFLISRIVIRKNRSAMLPGGAHETPIEYNQERLIYQGSELNFSEEILVEVLTKHFPYFNPLIPEDKARFVHRLKKFIARKTFIIHNNGGFREMPILLSASAIQLSFGLQRYLLPYFTFIHIFPGEFIGIHPTLRVLAGNVSGYGIHVSWKHFLEGYRYPQDGANVGLHEMAHAYYFQHFETEEHIDPAFTERFYFFNLWGNKIFEAHKALENSIYSSYAYKNFQEFWAESVELFFERPLPMKINYPDLYHAMAELLKQDPADHLLSTGLV